MKSQIAKTSFVLALLANSTAASAGQISGVHSSYVQYTGTIRDAAASRDGSIWFIDQNADIVGRINTLGEIKTLPFTPGVYLHNIIVDRDANAWFTANGHIGRITTSGALTDFRVQGNPARLTRGADGAIWFIDSNGVNDKIGRMTSSGVVSEYAFGANHVALDLTTGPDGNVWFIDGTANAVVKLSLQGSILATYPVPSAGYYGDEMVLGPDMNIWFTHGDNIDRVTPAGVVSEYPVPTAKSFPFPITAGADGNVWFAEYNSNKLGQVIVSTAKGNARPVINESDPVLNGPGVLFPLPAKTGLKAATECPSASFGAVGESSSSGANMSEVALAPLPKCADLWIVANGAVYGALGLPTFEYDYSIGNDGPDAVDASISIDMDAKGAYLESIVLIIDGSETPCSEDECDTPAPIGVGATGTVRLQFVPTHESEYVISSTAAIGPRAFDVDDPILSNNGTSFVDNPEQEFNVLMAELKKTAPAVSSRH